MSNLCDLSQVKPTFGRFIGVEVTSRPINDLNDYKEYFSLPKTMILAKAFKVPEVNLQLVTLSSSFKLDLRLQISLKNSFSISPVTSSVTTPQSPITL